MKSWFEMTEAERRAEDDVAKRGLERGASCAEELDLRTREDEFSADELAALERDELESLDELFGPGFAPGPPDGA